MQIASVGKEVYVLRDSKCSLLFTAEEGSRLTMCLCCSLQIVAQKRMVKPLLLKYGKYAGKSTITVSCFHVSYVLMTLLLWWMKFLRLLDSKVEVSWEK